MADACTPEERARRIELEIWKKVDSGELSITNGTYGEVYLKAWGYGADGCRACAIGSAARACGVVEVLKGHVKRRDMVEALEGRGIYSVAESLVMECGFEYGASDRDSARAGYFLGRGGRDLRIVDMPDDAFEAFWNLGLRLRARERPGT